MLYESLKKYRIQKGFSQEKFAEILCVSRQAVAKWETNQTYPDIENLVKISDVLGVSLDRLLKADGDKCTKKNINIDYRKFDIIEFLLESKRNCYAGEMVDLKPSSRLLSHDLKYEKGDLMYFDTYLGGEKFVGEEVLWKSGNPIWGMNYAGRVLDEPFSGKFLKEALSKGTTDNPYRGPAIYSDGAYRYHLVVSGDFDWFSGYEEIFYEDKKVYECHIHGGTIK